MKKCIVCFLIVFAGVSSHLKGQNPVSFFEEHIDFTLDTSCFIINGIYSFYNNTDREVNQHIIFPFADKTSRIDSIRILNLNTRKKIPFVLLENAVSFDFRLESKDTVDVNIFYRQKVSRINKYIITSTKSWGKPLETAVYTLTTEKKLQVKSFSYSPDSTKVVNGKKLYYWRKHHFMPEFDFEVTIDK